MSTQEPWDKKEADWMAAHKASQREYFAAEHKRVVSAMASNRIKKFEWAETMVDALKYAREALIAEQNGKAESLHSIVKWINDQKNDDGSSKFPAVEGGKFHYQLLSDLLYKTASDYADQAVLECRTRMTALALSADFETADAAVGDLENECINQIAKALILSRKLKGSFTETYTNEVAFKDARELARDIAKTQRQGKGMTMEARERLWKPTSRPVRLVLSTPK